MTAVVATSYQEHVRFSNVFAVSALTLAELHVYVQCTDELH